MDFGDYKASLAVALQPKFVAEHLMTHLEKNQLLHQKQCGFIFRHSTETANDLYFEKNKSRLD